MDLTICFKILEHTAKKNSLEFFLDGQREWLGSPIFELQGITIMYSNIKQQKILVANSKIIKINNQIGVNSKHIRVKQWNQ